MYKHTEYPTIRNFKPSTAFIPKYIQEKLDGANIRIIVPKDGSTIVLGTRKTILTGINHDYKNFKNTFQSKLKTLTLENMKPIIDGLNIVYDEFVIYGELVGPSIFARLNYGIKTLEVFCYDLFLFSHGERVFLPWNFEQLQTYLKDCGFNTIPFQQYSNEQYGEEYLPDLEYAKSFLNSEERVEGYILRGGEGKIIFKYKSNAFIDMETDRKWDPFKLPLKPTAELYRDLENKYGGFISMTPEKIVSVLVNELIENYYEVNEKLPTKNWIFGACRLSFIKFFPDITLKQNLIESAYKLLEKPF